ncbi:MAG: hypothetical protein ACI96M_004401 [Candidatus Azotimanducaceae bacterium]|jgi:hypothetical protein
MFNFRPGAEPNSTHPNSVFFGTDTDQSLNVGETMHTLEFAVASNQPAACAELADALGGHLYVDQRGKSGLPFEALLTVTTDDIEPLKALADVGLYVICRRLIKPGTPEKIALFPMVHHPDRSHAESDAHWRDVHAPLALVHHADMTHYTQLSVTHTISGEPWDGFALCGFASEDDIRNRFYTTKESVKVIAEDVGKFANPSASPRRLIATPTHMG